MSTVLTVVAVLNCVGRFLLLHCSPKHTQDISTHCNQRSILRWVGSIFTCAGPIMK